jgi:hypothetical protein
VLVLLLNADAVRFSGSESLPAVAVAAPVAGSASVPRIESVPRIVPAPFTSSVVAGVAVPMPILKGDVAD